MKKTVSLLLVSSLALGLAGCDADTQRHRAIEKKVVEFVEEANADKKLAPVLSELPNSETYIMDHYGYSFEVPEEFSLTEFYEENNEFQPDIIYISKEPISRTVDIGTYTSLAVWPAKNMEDYLTLVSEETGYTLLGTESINGYVYTKIGIDMNLNVPYKRISYVYDVSKDYTVAVFSYDEKNEAEAKPFLETLNFR